MAVVGYSLVMLPCEWTAVREGMWPMSVESVRAYLGPFGVADKIIEFDFTAGSDAEAEKALPRFVAPSDLPQVVGHPMGGVCPFAVKPGVRTYLDVSLRRFDRVFPAAGSESSAIGLTLPELERCSASEGWVDVCKDWREETA